MNDIHVVEHKLELVFGYTIRIQLALTSLFLISDLDFGLENFRLELALVVRFNAQSLVIQAFPEDLVSLFTPDFLPFALSLCQ